jgi:tetratricopeptide (TPR) repeat protein
MLGIVAAVYDYNLREAEQRFRLAMISDPVIPRIRQWYGHFYLERIGRIEEAIQLFKQVLKDDPLHNMGRLTLATSLLLVGKLQEAQAEAQKILELEKNLPWASQMLALTYVRQGNWKEALHVAENASPMIPEVMGTLAGVLKHLGEDKRAEELVGKLLSCNGYVASIGLAHYYHMCGELDKAAEWIEQAIEQRNPGAIGAAFSLFRSSSRWPALARMLNLPEEAQ